MSLSRIYSDLENPSPSPFPFIATYKGINAFVDGDESYS